MPEARSAGDITWISRGRVRSPGTPAKSSHNFKALATFAFGAAGPSERSQLGGLTGVEADPKPDPDLDLDIDEDIVFEAVEEVVDGVETEGFSVFAALGVVAVAVELAEAATTAAAAAAAVADDVADAYEAEAVAVE